MHPESVCPPWPGESSGYLLLLGLPGPQAQVLSNPLNLMPDVYRESLKDGRGRTYTRAFTDIAYLGFLVGFAENMEGAT